jgi:4-amino-4-deoxy-L-arabinose transferase-like glycosyltransferase
MRKVLLIQHLGEEMSALCVLLIIILLRLISFGHLAIADPTESRYAEIARRMYESKDYVTARLYVHGELIPYWGKPPLHFWFTTLSYQIFHVSEWSSRLPSIISGLLMLIVTFLFALRVWNKRVAFISTIVLASSGLFFVLWGSSIIDVTLSALMTISMVAFAMSILSSEKSSFWWGMLFFVSLALATLTKGLVAPFLSFLSIAIWWLTSIPHPSVRRFPWIAGSFVFLLISLPWFLIEENRTPGFLRYFLLNEHFLRFVKHDYGDKYGTGHMYPWGTSWVMLVSTFLPWTIFLVLGMRARFKKGNTFSELATDQIGIRYVLIWGLFPVLFFTFSRQLLATYLLPGFPAMAIATAAAITGWTTLWEKDFSRRICYTAALILPFAVAFGTFGFGRIIDQRSSIKPFFASLASAQQTRNLLLVFPFYEPASADFYENIYKSRAIVHGKESSVEFAAEGLIILQTKQLKNLAPEVRNHLALVHSLGEWSAFCQQAQAKGECNIFRSAQVKR